MTSSIGNWKTWQVSEKTSSHGPVGTHESGRLPGLDDQSVLHPLRGIRGLRCGIGLRDLLGRNRFASGVQCSAERQRTRGNGGGHVGQVINLERTMHDVRELVERD